MSANEPTQYLANPDVSCREEGPDGALLFNPDTDQVVVVNVTGLLIWRAVTQPRAQDQIVAALVEQCDNVPPDQVAQDVNEFLQKLVNKGIVGIYEGVVH